MSELLVALVVVPIVAAVLPPLLRWVRERSGWPVAAVALSIQTVLAVELARRVLSGGKISHAVGGFAPPVGIELVADGVAAPFVVLVAVVPLCLLAYTRTAGPRSNPFYSLYLLLVAGLTGLTLAGDIFNLYVFLEISGLAAYALVARTPGGEAALAALKYLFLGTVGATFYLLGAGYLYVATGTLNMTGIAVEVAAAGYDSRLVLAAFALMILGVGIKVALVPLHTWLPAAHSKAPVAVSVLLSGLVTGVAAYADVRLILTVFSPRFFEVVGIANDALIVAAAGSVIFGGLSAMRETKVKRVLAYSTVAQLGIAIMGISLIARTGMTGGVVHLLGHGIMKGGLFLVAGCFAARYGATAVEDYGGLARREPLVGAAFAVQALGMVGIPPTVGLLGKWYVALGAIEAGYWPVAALVFLSSLLSLAVFGPIIVRLYFHPDSPKASTPEGTGSISLGMKTVTVGAALATLVLGFAGPTLTRFLAPALEVL